MYNLYKSFRIFVLFSIFLYMTYIFLYVCIFSICLYVLLFWSMFFLGMLGIWRVFEGYAQVLAGGFCEVSIGLACFLSQVSICSNPMNQ